MKLKYKKIVLLTSLCTMGIGLLTFSITQEQPRAEDKAGTTDSRMADVPDNDSNENDTNGSEAAVAMAAIDNGLEDMASAESIATTTAAPTVTPTPTPTPIPVYPLEENEGVDAFFEEYYAAKAACDVDKLKSIYLDPTKVETREELENMVQYIEEYRNINTYIKKSIEDKAFIVYAYHEIKFSSINTLAPGLSKFYLVTDDEGNYKIASDIKPEFLDYFNARNIDMDVLELIETTNLRSEEAKSKDEDLMTFWNGLDDLANKAENSSN